jgi:hypothetical protein
MAVQAEKSPKSLRFFIRTASLGDYASISHGLSTVSSRRTVSSKPIVSNSDILVASVEMAFPIVSQMGSDKLLSDASYGSLGGWLPHAVQANVGSHARQSPSLWLSHAPHLFTQ